MKFHGQKGWLLAALAISLAGCGLSPQTSIKPTTASVPQGMTAESVPSAMELSRLESASPDRLIDHAPPEPGMGAEGLWPHPPAEDLGNFGKVEDTLWRGARPTDKGLAQLASMGVKTLVDFENDKGAVEHEQAWAQAHGINFVSIPLSVITPPKVANVNAWLKLAEDPSARPLYFHCMQGRDRTGTACFTYRVQHDHWTYDQAYGEMVKYHFHSYLLGLRAFLVWYVHHGQ